MLVLANNDATSVPSARRPFKEGSNIIREARSRILKEKRDGRVSTHTQRARKTVPGSAAESGARRNARGGPSHPLLTRLSATGSGRRGTRSSVARQGREVDNFSEAVGSSHAPLQFQRAMDDPECASTLYIFSWRRYLTNLGCSAHALHAPWSIDRQESHPSMSNGRRMHRLGILLLFMTDCTRAWTGGHLGQSRPASPAPSLEESGLSADMVPEV